jgi:hypothetical protein
LLKIVVPASDAYNAGMQYTVRNIPKSVDKALRQKAKQQGRSLNEELLHAIASWTGIGATPVKKRDLRHIAGTYVHDPGFEQAMRDQDTIHPDDWK